MSADLPVWDPWSHLQTEKEQVQQIHTVEQLPRNECPGGSKHDKSKSGASPKQRKVLPLRQVGEGAATTVSWRWLQVGSWVPDMRLSSKQKTREPDKHLGLRKKRILFKTLPGKRKPKVRELAAMPTRSRHMTTTTVVAQPSSPTLELKHDAGQWASQNLPWLLLFQNAHQNHHSDLEASVPTATDSPWHGLNHQPGLPA